MNSPFSTIQDEEIKEEQKIDDVSVSEENEISSLNKDLETNVDQQQTTKQQRIETESSDQQEGENQSQEPATEIIDEKTARLQYCKNLIADIREKQFGVGVKFGIKGMLLNLSSFTKLTPTPNCFSRISSIKFLQYFKRAVFSSMISVAGSWD